VLENRTPPSSLETKCIAFDTSTANILGGGVEVETELRCTFNTYNSYFNSTISEWGFSFNRKGSYQRERLL